MKLAIATNDKQTIPKNHFGESRYFCIVNLMNAQFFNDECRVNPFPEHQTTGKSEKILTLLEDCDAMIGKSFGSGSFLRIAGKKKQLVLTSLERIEEVVASFVNGDLRSFRQFDLQKKKFFSMEDYGAS